MIVGRVQGPEGSDRRGNRLSEGHRIGSRYGAAELSTVDEGEDILGEFIVVCRMDNATRRSVDGEEGSPVSCQESITA